MSRTPLSRFSELINASICFSLQYKAPLDINSLIHACIHLSTPKGQKYSCTVNFKYIILYKMYNIQMLSLCNIHIVIVIIMQFSQDMQTLLKIYYKSNLICYFWYFNMDLRLFRHSFIWLIKFILDEAPTKSIHQMWENVTLSMFRKKNNYQFYIYIKIIDNGAWLVIFLMLVASIKIFKQWIRRMIFVKNCLVKIDCAKRVDMYCHCRHTLGFFLVWKQT